MAEGILFGIAQEIILNLGEQAVKEIGLIWGVKTELLKLKETVLTIRAVLLDAEEKQANAQVKIWLEKLADAVYDADNVVDEFRYRLPRRRLVFGNKRAKKRKQSRRRWVSSLTSCLQVPSNIDGECLLKRKENLGFLCQASQQVQDAQYLLVFKSDYSVKAS